MMFPTRQQLEIERLGQPAFASPLRAHELFVDEQDRVLVSSSAKQLSALLEAGRAIPSFERAGPRETLYFQPARTRCAIVTCGGLCPGENDVIRSIVLTLTHSYGVHQIMGVRYGYAGLSAYPPEPPMELTPERVEGLLGQGGSLLASSRGPQDVPAMVEMLFQQRIDALFAIGGDGTMRGAEALSDEVARRRLPIAVMGIPKTIDNDVAWIDHSFGFSTAVEEARRAIAAAHLEATSRWNGVGVVELEGRDSGLIAAHAALSNPHVNFCLVPELPFPIDGECGLLWALERRLEARHHAVVVVASGASPAPQAAEEWAAGGIARGGRSGRYLRDRIEQHFRARREVIHLSYIDPSHLMRTSAANATDSELCLHLGQHAVHAAMAGRTCLLIGSWHGHFTHVPLGLATARPRRIDPRGSLWQSVLESTGQHMCLRGQRPQDSSPPRA